MATWDVLRTKKAAMSVAEALKLVYGKVCVVKRYDGFAIVFNDKKKSWYMKNQKNLKELFK